MTASRGSVKQTGRPICSLRIPGYVSAAPSMTRQGQTGCEAGTQSHGTLWVSRATERCRNLKPGSQPRGKTGLCSGCLEDVWGCEATLLILFASDPSGSGPAFSPGGRTESPERTSCKSRSETRKRAARCGCNSFTGVAPPLFFFPRSSVTFAPTTRRPPNWVERERARCAALRPAHNASLIRVRRRDVAGQMVHLEVLGEALVAAVV
jgi:hypothetical protein